MGITIKKPEEIEQIRQGGKLLAKILDEVLAAAKPGVKTIELDQMAEEKILAVGGVPAFKHHKTHPDDTPFPSTICASVNEELVHTPAGERVLQDGDIFTVDIGMRYPAEDGFYTDMARTIPVGEVSDEAKKIIEVTKKSFDKGMEMVKAGNKISDIGKAIQQYVESNGFSVVRQLVGHGVGYEVHEDPRVPNYYDPKMPEVEMQAGLVIAVEPMVNVGSYEIDTLDDGWTIASADGSLCAHHENTLVVTDQGFEILTQA